MCGIAGCFLADTNISCNSEIYEALGLLQHRGQDAAGIVTCGQRGRLYQCKANGMVRDVFPPSQLTQLLGSMGVGHVRYPTAGTSSTSEAQPFYVNSPYGLICAHNGNLTNTPVLKKYLDEVAHRHVNTESDSEVLLNVFADHLQQTGKSRINEDDIFNALTKLFDMCLGGYACILMIAGFGILGFRDPHGLRPLIYGSRKTEFGTDYMMASESVVLESLGYSDFIDVAPGQGVMITKDGVSVRQCAKAKEFTPCIFEYVYFARPDSIMDGISVYKSRLAMGEALATQVIKDLGEENDIDVVIPVPDTSRTAALQVSYKLNKLYREGFIKNRYIGRTFIMPGQTQRIKSVRRKLNPMPMEFAGKNVLLVDGICYLTLDSIVRGTTSREIILMAREAGAKKVYFASCAPAIRYPNVYGIDMPTRQELIAYNRNTEQIAQEIGADRIIFQDLENLVQSVAKFNPEITKFDVSVFTGCYVTGDIDEAYLRSLEKQRSLSMQNLRIPTSDDVMGLFNNFNGRK
ncbi:amidophosphoribosyltransferase [Terramyces sp. JEL0728]|nr:amidophosphoribosyltransferase [Terramyces sp. JEL0728]